MTHFYKFSVLTRRHKVQPMAPQKPMSRSTRTAALTSTLALSITSILMASPAWALDFVEARAFQNLDAVVMLDNNTGSSATAQKEYVAGSAGSAANTSRTSTFATAFGYGVTTTTHYDASSSTRSQFTLWDLSSNSALVSAAGLALSFNFSLNGHLNVGPTSISTGVLSYEAELRNASNAVAQEQLSNASSTYGPGPGGPQYLNFGNPTLLGSFSQSFSLLQTVGDLYGTLFMSSVTLASNISEAQVGLNLDSITLVAGVAPTGGLGVRLDQTGLVIPVTAVPEPATWAMWLAGLAAAMSKMRSARSS